jgi:hypothetical protein
MQPSRGALHGRAPPTCQPFVIQRGSQVAFERHDTTPGDIVTLIANVKLAGVREARSRLRENHGFRGPFAGRSQVRWICRSGRERQGTRGSHLHSTDVMKAIAPSRISSSRPVTGSAARSLRLVTSLGAVLLSMAAGSPTAHAAPKDSAQTVQITDKARELFRTGVTLLQDPDGARNEDAYQQFKAAYAESPSWKILGNLGVTAMRLERDGEAIEAFRGYLEQGGKELSRAERAQFQSDLDTLSATAATVSILGLPAGTRLTDVRSPNQGSDIKNYYEVRESEPLVLRVRPGAHRFTAQWGGREPQTHELEISARGAHEVKFEAVQPEPAQPRPVAAPASEPAPLSVSSSDDGFFQSPLPAYISLGVGAVGVGLGVVFLTQRSSAISDADSKYQVCLESQACVLSDQRSMEELDEKATTMGTFSAVSFGVGAVGLGAGVALLLMNGKTEEGSATAAGVTVQPYASAHELGLWGRF